MNFVPSQKNRLMNSTHIIIASIALILFPMQNLVADLVEFVAVDDGDVRIFGGNSTDTTDELLNLSQSGANIDNVVLEFDVNSLDSSRTILSATLDLVHDRNLIQTAGSDVPVSIFAYSGDGSVEVADFDEVGVNAGDFGVALDTIDGTLLSFDLDLSPIQSIIAGGASFLTLRLETESFSRIEFASSENPNFEPPNLRLETSAVPEPNGMTMLILSATLLLRRYRNHRK